MAEKINMRYFCLVIVFVLEIKFVLSTEYNIPDVNWPQLKNYNHNDTEESKHVKRIVAFGDSITEGYLTNKKGELKFFPYSTKLEDLLNKHSTSIRFEVVNEGISGECVFTEMATRLPAVLNRYQNNLDLVIILGGTNDLRKVDCDKKVNVAYELIQLHTLVHNKGIKTVAVTIPEADETDSTLTYYGYKKYKQIWRDINKKLRAYADNNKETTLLCDVAKKLPMDTLDDQDRLKHWSDPLHPSKLGYKKLAELFFEVIRSEYQL